MPGSKLLSAPMTADHVIDIATLTVQARRGHGLCVISLSGELDIAGADALEAQLARVEASVGLQHLEIDLRGLRFIDSTGLRLLIQAAARARTSAHRLRIVRPAGTVFRVFEIAGVDGLLPFADAPIEADA